MQTQHVKFTGNGGASALARLLEAGGYRPEKQDHGAWIFACPACFHQHAYNNATTEKTAVLDNIDGQPQFRCWRGCTEPQIAGALETAHPDLYTGWFQHPTPADTRWIDWPTFWATDHNQQDWLIPDVIAARRGHAIYARHGQGKSLFTLWVAAEISRTHPVLYLDYEMTPGDVKERLIDMGYGPTDNLNNLKYWLLPDIPPLDTQEGGTELLRLALEQHAHGGTDQIVVIIDTIGRALQGDENSNDTARSYYRHTGQGLKELGATVIRTDHAGWSDESKGARGGSAKGDDVDIVWKLTPQDGGVDLVRMKARMGWVPERVSLGQVLEPRLAYRPVTANWPAGTDECAGLLNTFAVPLDVKLRDAQAVLQAAGHGRRKAVVAAAIRWRQLESEKG